MVVDITQILSQIEQGDRAAADDLLPLVYDELRRLAASKLAQEKPGQTLEATALVHEAYLKLIGRGDSLPQWESRAHFFAAAAESMRRILVDNARRKRAIKRGGNYDRIDWDLASPLAAVRDDRLLALDEALKRLEEAYPRQAELVKLRFFVGLTSREAAQTLGISTATAIRHWAFARAWLQDQMGTLEP